MRRNYSLLLLTLFLASCSSSPQNPNTVELYKNAPTVLNARSEPSVVIMNSDMEPVTPTQVFADVKDFSSPVVDVRLKFNDVPIEVPMQRVGTTSVWKTELTPQQLQMLAISGDTVKYKATVIAKDMNGNSTQTAQPLFVTVKAPQIARYG
jgi:hypothetical protein